MAAEHTSKAATTAIVERASRITVIVATAWFMLAAFWGIDGTPGGGHIGSSGSAVAMLGEHMIRWHTWYPLQNWYANTKPGLEYAYCHHPFGLEWCAAFFALFVHHKDFLIPLPAALMSSATVPLLAGIGRRLGGAIAGAATALGFVVLPITIGFSNFSNLEVIVMFGVALFFWGHLAYQESGRSEHLIASLAGALFTGFGDWPGYIMAAPLLAWGLLRSTVLPAWMTPPIRVRYHKWWALSVAAFVFTFALTVAMFKHADKMDDWLNSADSRSGGVDVPIQAVLESRRTWIEFSFTPLAIALGKIAAYIAPVRLLAKRRDVEIMSLSVLAGAVVQYLVFKRGADIHIFWPHYFGLYFALAMGTLAATVQQTITWIGGFFDPRRARDVGWIGAALVGIVPSLLIFPDGYRSLRIWRETGGRYNDRGAPVRTNGELLWLLSERVRPHLRFGDTVGVHPGTPWGWEGQWAIAAQSETVATPGRHRFWAARIGGMNAEELKKLVTTHHTQFYGNDMVIVDRDDDVDHRLDAYSLNEREPGLFEGYFRYNVEPARSLTGKLDPYLTWDWRDAFGLAAELPTAAPVTLEEKRIAHNIAVSQGDVARAEKLRGEIISELDANAQAYFTGGHAIIGVRVTHGAKPLLETWFEAGGPTAGETTFAVRSKMETPGRFSLIPLDTVERDMTYLHGLSTKLWKAGYIYRSQVELDHRIGRELYTGAFVSRDGQPAPTPKHSQRVDLALVP